VKAGQKDGNSFASLEVLLGGSGAGTVFRLGMNVMGARSSIEMTVTEPDPGRVIRERDEAAVLTENDRVRGGG
jgi:hypothetical protein